MSVLYLILLVLTQFCRALLEERFVAFEPLNASIPIHTATIVYSTDDPVGIEIASKSLAIDLEQITGKRPSTSAQHGTNQSFLGNTTASSVIITGTVDSPVLLELESEGKIDLSDIRGKWETFMTTTVVDPLPGVRQGLVIAGSDKRGAMFGIYTLAEQCGQSPFHWWLDVPATKHHELYALPKTTVHGEPSVKYRGLFINDEAPALTGWWSKKHSVDHYPLDSEFYRHVFDLLLRLKANYLWPAMWASFVPRPGNIFFTDDPQNQQLADDYGIVVSTSHHEPMQRATNEWNETETGPWDWTENKANVTRFMEEGVRRAGRNESYFTLGMRGPNDGPIEADDPISVLEDVFAAERELLAKYHGNETAANQVWTIYKEVATYYAAGLTPSEDITLMFTDDNWGNVQRLPTGNETERSGGIGIYFHLEYVGVPKSYKWQNSNSLAKVYKDLFHSYERGADRIWVINIADIKPMEMPFGFIMDLAWNTSTIDFSSIPDYLEAFAEREFGVDNAREISSILLQHNLLIARRKLESIEPGTYSILNYHESETVLLQWRDLARRVSNVATTIDQDRRPAFFHLVRYPVQAGYLHHSMVLGQGRNRQYGYERRNTANKVAQQILADFDSDFDLLEEYNNLEDGKWTGIMDQPKLDMALSSSWKATSRDVLANISFVQLRQNMDYAWGNLGIYAEGSLSAWRQGFICASIDPSMPTDGSFAPTLPTMDRYGPAVRTVDLFHRGDHRVPVEWSIETPFDWITVAPQSGSVSDSQPEQRLNISINWPAVAANFNDEVAIRVNFNTTPYFDLIRVPINGYSAPADFHGFPETASYISIEAPHYQRSSDSEVAFQQIPYLGTRTTSGSIALRPYQTARHASDAKAAWVEYDFYLFNQSTALNATVYINAALDTDPALLMQYSLTLDAAEANFTRVLGDPDKAGDLPPGWTQSVADGVWKRTVGFGAVERGSHTLRWMTNSPEVYLEKVVLDTRGGVGASYLGPPETALI
ncbi:hypothetical protein MPH_05244 [Macrophomina phaseolina MS6]|uniref:Gylcosyl hydrolase 115 C-terminal domain-containing protein n=1 Tax=Macrophomina phaseolina (strain MS6) TaxID=1126212 RepID=K2RXT4_MACPH|nr:hypothetical protein MPH_05244 [Macrophomina phaseolina MS6]